MTTEKRIASLLAADPDKLEWIDRILTGKASAAELTDRKLYNMTQAAQVLNVSRATLWRMVKAGRIAAVEIRPGVQRVPSAAITALLTGGAA